MYQDESKLESEKHLFRYKQETRVLEVRESNEPSTIRWQDLNSTFYERTKRQIIMFTVTILVALLLFFLLYQMRTQKALYVSFMVSGFNVIFPMIAECLTAFEFHKSASTKETSLFMKVAGFRWINTAVTIQLFKPFTHTLSAEKNSMIPFIYAIFFADIITSNAIQILDPLGHIKRHFFGPHASSQESMNSNFQGVSYSLAERYTNMTKIIFLTVYYCAIFPSSFFFCSVALYINYWADKFSIMRTWEPAPKIGVSIAEICRRYFFPLIMIAYALSSSYLFSGFPFDNLCVSTINAGEYDGVYILNNQTTTTTIGSNTQLYHFCNQDFWETSRYSFPALPRFQYDDKWMTAEQEHLTTIYGYSSIFIILLIFFKLVKSTVQHTLEEFKGQYMACGDDQGINFSEIPSVSAYIPQVHSKYYSFPLIACRTDQINPELLDWTDPDHSYDYYNLTKDCDEVLAGDIVNSDAADRCFNFIKQYPPGSEPVSKPETLRISTLLGNSKNNNHDEHDKPKPNIDSKLLDIHEGSTQNTLETKEDSTANTHHRRGIRHALGNLGESVWDLS
mmetsp:Transcript_3896/g.5032  ORF Transcript_3896/g.5032 Transcript_3896/m.5032 type:complete len:564 (+) Transcript_3896:145-1836(+)